MLTGAEAVEMWMALHSQCSDHYHSLQQKNFGTPLDRYWGWTS